MNIARGTRVRVTYEATFDGVNTGPDRGWYVRDERNHWFSTPADATIEPIEDLRPGDIVIDANSDIWSRSFNSPEWYFVSTSGMQCSGVPGRRDEKHVRDGWYEDSAAVRPLTLLVRDGKAVTS